MFENITLKGITWNHSRSSPPLAATAQRFAELNPTVTITWEKRSLQQFADLSTQQLICFIVVLYYRISDYKIKKQLA